MSNNTFDESQLFEDSFLEWIRTITIFIIAGIAIFNFTRYGKLFSVISFTISVVLVGALIIYYLNERKRVIDLGLNINFVLDILFGCIVVTFFYLLFLLWETIITDPSSGFSFPINFIEEEVNILADKIITGLKQ